MMGLLATIILAATLSDASFLRMGPMSVEPTIDGEITTAEARASSVQYGAVSRDDGLMAMRYAVFHVGYTAKGVYFAARTSVPEAPQTLTDADTVTLTLLPPGAAASSRQPFRFTVRVKDGVVSAVQPSTSNLQPVLAASRQLKGVADYAELCAETELFVPYTALDVAGAKDGEKWGLQMSVDFSSQPETAVWHYGRRDEGRGMRDELGTLEIDSGAPVLSLVNFYTLEQWRQSGTYRFLFRYVNKTGRLVRLDPTKSVLHRGVGVAKLDSNPETDVTIEHSQFADVAGFVLAPDEDKEVSHVEWVIWPGNVNILELDIGSGGRPLFRRRLSWNGVYRKKWADAKGLPVLKTAFFPSSNNRLRMKVFPNKVTDLVSGSLMVRGKKSGKTAWSQELVGKPSLTVETFDVNLPGLPEDDYTVAFEATDKKGETYCHVRTFQVKSFPWQTAEVGMDRIIIPPYRPIKVGMTNEELGMKDGPTISFLQTGYRCGGVLWDEIYGKGENLLAAPMRLELNGREFTVTSAKFVEQSPDRVIREVSATLSTSQPSQHLNLHVTQNYDYDGFCWTTLDFDAPQPVEVKSLRIFAPLRNEFAKYFDVQRRIDKRSGPAPDCTLKGGEGEVWNSLMNVDNKWWNTQFPASIQPYFWFGGAFKGLAWIMDGVRDLSLDRNIAPQRVIRRGDAATYEVDLVNKPVVWQGRKSFEMGWQPTPVRPKDPSHGAFASLMYNYACPSNAVRCELDYSLSLEAIHAPENVYPGDDMSFPDWVHGQKARINKTYGQWDCTEYKSRLKDYIARNKAWFDASKVVTATDYWYGKINCARNFGVDLMLRYMDPMLITSFWPEWEMYKAEWYPEEWAPDNYFNEYMAQLCKSRIDKLMWDGKRALELGAGGLYFDCYRLASSWNLGNKSVYLRPDGTVQMQMGNILAWRDIMKRSAVICCKMGKTYHGRPVVEDHDTNGHIVPTMSWAMTGLSTERSGGGGDFQDRFPESYTLVAITGGQTGKGTRFIVSSNAGDEARRNRELVSLMSFMCAYGIFSLNDQGVIGGNDRFEKAWNRVFDFGWGKPTVEQYQYWNEYQTQPVAHTGRNIRLTVAKKRDSALLLFGNLGDAEMFSFDVKGLGFGPVTLTDAETGEELKVEGVERVEGFVVGRHDFRQVLVTEVGDVGPVPVAITFDDGCRGQLAIAEPMLAARGWKGTFNIVTGWKSGVLSWDEIRELQRRGHEITSHSVSHPRMVTLLEEGKTNEVVRQLRESAATIERETGRKPRWFCAPYVQQNAELDRLARSEGMRVMTVPRIPFGGKHPPDKNYGRVLDSALAKNPKALDLLIHGITKATGGWGPFDDEKDFADFLDAVAERERKGLIRVVPYDQAYSAFAGK